MRFLLLLVAFLAAQGAIYGQSRSINKVVVILADDHAYKATGAFGNTVVQTPNIDRLSRNGITFRNAFCNAPISSASRQSLLTGKYPHATGVSLAFTPFPDQGNTTIAEYLEKKGYRTALIGQSHFNNWVWGELYENGLPNHGFNRIIDHTDYRRFHQYDHISESSYALETYDPVAAQHSTAELMNARMLPHPVYDNHSEGTYYANQAIEFMRENTSRPFFLWLAFSEPEAPFYFPVEYAGRYTPDDVELPRGGQEDDRWVPEQYNNLTTEQKKGIIASYYTATTYLDKNVGMVLKAIERLGIDDETIVLYLSDNGYLLYDHKRFEKQSLWEEAVRTPAILKVPGMHSRYADQLVEHVDLVPTLLELLNLPPLPDAQGESMVPLLQNAEAKHKGYVFSSYLEDNMAMVRTDRWKYIYTTGSRDLGNGFQTGKGPSGIIHRLYDLQNDPGETTNLAYMGYYEAEFQKMQMLMLNQFMLTHPDAVKCPRNLSVEGKLAWFCEPRDVGANQSMVQGPVRVFSNKPGQF